MRPIKAAYASKAPHVPLSGVVGALSCALDLAEGQPEGHAARSCMIGMRIGQEIGLDASQRSALFYVLLLKDLGCSSNSASVCAMFGADDRTVKREFKLSDWQNPLAFLPYTMRNISPEDTWCGRARRVLSIAMAGNKEANGFVRMRCERGASLARNLDLPPEAGLAIRHLDEHWNGKGHPDGLRKSTIPLMARIACLAQTAEIFATHSGPAAATAIVRKRRGSWFDPDLVRAFESIGHDAGFWAGVLGEDAPRRVAQFEPEGLVIEANEAMIDRLCRVFSLVVDAKSPWTACHSQGVSDVAVGIGMTLGLDPGTLMHLRRAGLLHDLGKLAVSNTILDKPGGLTDRQFAVLKAHPEHARRILSRCACFASVAELVGRHHEKLDGSGYPDGLDASQLSLPHRILCVADMYEALAAKRPYRDDLREGEVFDILRKQAGTTICAESFEALCVFVHSSRFRPYQLAA